jgi:hypothetical protein
VSTSPAISLAEFNLDKATIEKWSSTNSKWKSIDVEDIGMFSLQNDIGASVSYFNLNPNSNSFA